jgi:hypothetical protein
VGITANAQAYLRRQMEPVRNPEGGPSKARPIKSGGGRKKT